MPTPEEATVSGGGMTPSEQAAETRQAEFVMGNDLLLDTNMNATLARVQALTFSLAGGAFQSNNDIRQKLQDRILYTPITIPKPL